jgi:PadR family transcriptional regulator PadR
VEVIVKLLGTLEQSLMFTVVRLGDMAHGLAIRQELERRTGRTVSHGAVYTTMDRLAERGLVVSEIREDVPAGGGPRRKFYHVTPDGAATLLASYRSLTRLARGALPSLTDLAGEAGADE